METELGPGLHRKYAQLCSSSWVKDMSVRKQVGPKASGVQAKLSCSIGSLSTLCPPLPGCAVLYPTSLLALCILPGPLPSSHLPCFSGISVLAGGHLSLPMSTRHLGLTLMAFSMLWYCSACS